MKKILLVLIAVIGFGIVSKAQDVILKKDASEIKAKVLEVTDQQIKYKDFDFQSGPTRNIDISEVFMITYENGQKEVFNKISETNTSSGTSTSRPKPQTATNCAKKLAFGLDIGIGGSFLKMYDAKSFTLVAPSLGIRVMHHFNPYFGVDFLKINWITDVRQNLWQMRLQLMPGIRGNSPVFYKCMSAYAAFRLGYAMEFENNFSHFKGLALETEVGLNLTRTVFMGFAYNYHNFFGYGFDGLAMHTFLFRVGFNLGK